jgi:hypothetical protein
MNDSFEIKLPLDAVCPECYAAIGARCTVPRDGRVGITGTGGTFVVGFHNARWKTVGIEPPKPNELVAQVSGC